MKRIQLMSAVAGLALVTAAPALAQTLAPTAPGATPPATVPGAAPATTTTPPPSVRSPRIRDAGDSRDADRSELSLPPRPRRQPARARQGLVTASQAAIQHSPVRQAGV